MHASDKSTYNGWIISIQNITFILYKEINESRSILKLMRAAVYVIKPLLYN